MAHSHAVTFADAPGDRGTEIHVDLAKTTRGGKGRAGRDLVEIDTDR